MTYSRPREIDPDVRSYEEACRSYTWAVPERFNLAEDVCDRHALNPRTADRVALYWEHHQGQEARYTFAQLKRLSDRLANALAAHGLIRGERLAVLLPQRPETALAHLAASKLGVIVVPLTVMFRREALRYRLEDSGARGIIVAAESLPLVEELLPDLPNLDTVLLVDGKDTRLGRARVLDFWGAVDEASDTFTRLDTRAEDPALIVYTSGTTGAPKGALHAQRFLLGHLPGFEFTHNFAPQPGDCFWSPADWAWVVGLMNILLCSWHHAIPVVGFQGPGGFDPERTFRLMAKYQVRNTFLPPTALKMMAQQPGPRPRHQVALRTLLSGGEAVGSQVLGWVERELGVHINEAFGQTEMNYFIGNCHRLFPVRPGSMGRPFPGHRVAILDEQGRPLPPGQVGEIALHAEGDPAVFLGYWNNPQATREKFAGPWGRTGDLATLDEDGYLWFNGRKDDVIISAGHRFGPAEIEAALLRHPAVALAAVVATPDPLRNHVAKAFIKPKSGYTPSEALGREIQEFVKQTLAVHEYPREVEFLDEFPLTPTGKVRRVELRERENERKRVRAEPAGR